MALRPANNSERKSAEQRYKGLLEQVAQDRGPSFAETAAEKVKSMPSTAWNMLMDIALRTDAAAAGMWETAYGQGLEGDNPFSRYWREALGGTKLGNALGIGAPTQKTSRDLFFSTGVARGMDPVTREAAALAFGVLIDPITYFSMGSGSAGKMVGKAGTIVASPKAQALVARLYQSKIHTLAKTHGIQRLAKVGTTEWKGFEQAVLTAERNAIGWAGLGDRGWAEVGLKLRRQAEARVVDMAKRGKVSGLDMGRGIRVGDASWLPFVKYRGIKIVDFEKAGELGKVITDALRKGRGTRELMQAADGVTGFFDGVFNRVPKAMRNMPVFRKLEERRHSLLHAAPQIAAHQMNVIKGRLSRDVWENKKFWKAFMLAADNPAVYMRPLKEAFGDEAVNAVRRWRGIANDAGSSAVKLKILEPEQVAKWEGNFFPRRINAKKAGIAEEAGTGAKREFAGGSISPSDLERTTDSFDEMGEVLAKAGLDPDEVIDWNMPRLMEEYLRRHVESVAGMNFANDVVAEVAPSFGSVFAKLSGELANPKALDRGQLERAWGAIRAIREKDFSDAGKAAVKALADADSYTRAYVIREAAMDVKSFEELGKLMERLRTVMDKTDLRIFNEIRSDTVAGKVMRLVDLDVTTHTFRSGRLENQQYLIPKAMKQFFVDNERILQNGLSKESQGILKTFDLITNTFKSSHTVLFPAFHARNGMSNVAAMMATTSLDNVLNPARAIRAWQIMHGKFKGTIRAADGTLYTGQELTALFDALDIAPNRVLQAEFVGGQKSLMGRTYGLRVIEREAGRVGMGIENQARGHYFLTMLENGIEPTEAARLMKQVMFDYNDLSVTEANLFRRLFPFYTWTRKNIEMQARNLATRPGPTLAQVRALSDRDRGPRSELMPDFLRGQLKVRLDSGKGNQLFINNIDLPVSNIDVIWAGGIGKTMLKHFEMFTPILKAPLEHMLNLDTFTGRPIRGRQWLGNIATEIEQGWPKWAQDYIQFEKVADSTGRESYYANGLRMWLPDQKPRCRTACARNRQIR
jgi:hypothetical protein